MLTIKNINSVTAITFDFISTTRYISYDEPVTVPLNSFNSMQCTVANDCDKSTNYKPRRNDCFINFKSRDGSEIDTYVVSESTFNILYRIFMKNEYDDEHVVSKRVIEFFSDNVDDYIPIFIEDIENVSCVTYRGSEFYRVQLNDDLFEISEEDYEFLKKLLNEITKKHE